MNNLHLNHNLSGNSWFGLGGNAKKFFTPDTEEELINYLRHCKSDNFITIGSGSNILFRDKGCSDTVIKLGDNFRKIEKLRGKYELILSKILTDGVKENLFFCKDIKITSLAIIGMLKELNTWYKKDGRVSVLEVKNIYKEIVLKAVS